MSMLFAIVSHQISRSPIKAHKGLFSCRTKSRYKGKVVVRHIWLRPWLGLQLAISRQHNSSGITQASTNRLIYPSARICKTCLPSIISKGKDTDPSRLRLQTILNQAHRASLTSTILKMGTNLIKWTKWHKWKMTILRMLNSQLASRIGTYSPILGATKRMLRVPWKITARSQLKVMTSIQLSKVLWATKMIEEVQIIESTQMLYRMEAAPTSRMYRVSLTPIRCSSNLNRIRFKLASNTLPITELHHWTRASKVR